MAFNTRKQFQNMPARVTLVIWSFPVSKSWKHRIQNRSRPPDWGLLSSKCEINGNQYFILQKV